MEIPKGTGTRPLGIPTVKDRIVQAAVKRVIEPIFEHAFLPLTARSDLAAVNLRPPAPTRHREATGRGKDPRRSMRRMTATPLLARSD